MQEYLIQSCSLRGGKYDNMNKKSGHVTFLDLPQIKFAIILAENCYRTTNPCYGTVWQDLLPDDDRISIKDTFYFYQHPSVHDKRVVMAGAAECVVIFIHGLLVRFVSFFSFWDKDISHSESSDIFLKKEKFEDQGSLLLTSVPSPLSCKMCFRIMHCIHCLSSDIGCWCCLVANFGARAIWMDLAVKYFASPFIYIYTDNPNRMQCFFF